MKKNDNLITLDEFIDQEYGNKGTQKREKFEQGYKEFKSGVIINELAITKDLTQNQLVDKRRK
jgi:HTH-type transcriptional regulator / antitoxin HipB